MLARVVARQRHASARATHFKASVAVDLLDLPALAVFDPPAGLGPQAPLVMARLDLVADPDPLPPARVDRPPVVDHASLDQPLAGLLVEAACEVVRRDRQRQRVSGLSALPPVLEDRSTHLLRAARSDPLVLLVELERPRVAVAQQKRSAAPPTPR